MNYEDRVSNKVYYHCKIKDSFLVFSHFVFTIQYLFINMGGHYKMSSLLFRDGIKNHNSKVAECQYGCNRKLVKFNQEVEGLLSNV